MNPHNLSQRVLFFCSIVTLILIHIPSSLCADDNLYVNCNQTFDCSGHKNLNYPFWGSNRPNYCGHPYFELRNCTEDKPVMTIESLNYRVVDLNQSQKSLVIARIDYWENACPTGLHNISFNTSILNFASGSSQDLTLYYKCPPLQSLIPPPSLFICDTNDTLSFNYFVTENIRSQLATVINTQTCEETVVLRISNTEVGKLSTNTTLVPALKAGFGLTWDVNESSCDECKSSGGHCGSDQNSSSEFVCYCKDGTQSSRCGSGGNSNVAKSVGLSIAGTCILGICIGCLLYFLIQRRKKLSIQAKDKDIITPPSSKSGPTTSNSFSRSIPSYATSKSDLEKGSSYYGAQVFSYTELEEATDNFDHSRELGDGGFGTVYYGKLRDGRVVAVKRLYENNFKRVEQFMNEVEILTHLEHHNLVKLYGCTSIRSRELLLVYEYIPNGTVADHLHGKRANSGLLTWQVRLSIAIETAEALAYLHRSDVIHRDVKTNNILLDNDFRVKVADFGLSRLFPNDVTHVSTAPQGTPGYVDPEYYQYYQLTDKSDVYSFGVVLIELISSLQAVDTNRHRLDINLASMAINKVQNQALNEFIDPFLGFEKNSSVRRMATAVAELAFRCLQQERDMRPTMEEVVAVLKAIKNKDFSTENVEVVDIRSDDVGLLKSMPPPLSPDSTDKWVSSSRTNSL